MSVIVAAYQTGGWPLTARATIARMKRAKNTKNKICAIPAEAEAIPPKPNTPATIATIKNVSAHPSMSVSFAVSLTRQRDGTAKVPRKFAGVYRAVFAKWLFAFDLFNRPDIDDVLNM